MSKLAIDANAKGIQCLRPNITDDVAVSGTAASATAVSANARVVRIVANVDIHYTINATATTADVFLPSRSIEYIHVYAGDVISMIAPSAGIAYVTEMV
jgi:hypothetical protein